MKQVCFFLFFFITPVLLFAQIPDSIVNAKDSALHKDSISFAQDSLKLKLDTANKSAPVVKKVETYAAALESLLKKNRFLNTAGRPEALVNQIKKHSSQDNFFYLLLGLGTVLGFFRFFYARYFNNLFRVFFNASLRQTQLTDQLLQAKLPSLFFNTLFVLSGGVYIFLLLRYYNWISMDNFWRVLIYCILGLGIIYLIKFLTLKFTGWLTGFQKVTTTYAFIIFLINKILGILLIPFLIIIAFSTPELITAAVIISLLFTGLMIVLRFFRSYGLLQHQLKISRLHFFMYVIGIEILPVLLIYKGLVILLSKNL